MRVERDVRNEAEGEDEDDRLCEQGVLSPLLPSVAGAGLRLGLKLRGRNNFAPLVVGLRRRIGFIRLYSSLDLEPADPEPLHGGSVVRTCLGITASERSRLTTL